MCTGRSGRGRVVEHRCWYCIATLDMMEMSLFSSPDVSPFSSSPLLMSSCGDRSDVAADLALLPCENRCEKKSPQRYARGMQVVDVTSILFFSSLSLKSSFMLVMMVVVDVVCRALMYHFFALEPLTHVRRTEALRCCREVACVRMFQKFANSVKFSCEFIGLVSPVQGFRPLQKDSTQNCRSASQFSDF